MIVTLATGGVATFNDAAGGDSTFTVAAAGAGTFSDGAAVAIAGFAWGTELPTTAPPGNPVDCGASESGAGSGAGAWAATTDAPATTAAFASHWRIPRMFSLAGCGPTHRKSGSSSL
jgi:hypothetical protein